MFKKYCKHTSVYLCKLNAHIKDRSVRYLRFGFRSTYFPIQSYWHSLWHIKMHLPEQTCFSLSESKHRFNSLSWTNTQRRCLKDTFALCSIRRLTAFFKCLDMAGKMRFLLLHRKCLQTTANTHQFTSVSWMHTLKPVLLGSSILVLESDISQYCVCSNSLGNIKTQLPEQRRF